MPKQLRFYLQNGKKIYTLEEEIKGVKTQEAHYKFLRLKDESEIRKNDF